MEGEEKGGGVWTPKFCFLARNFKLWCELPHLPIEALHFGAIRPGGQSCRLAFLKKLNMNSNYLFGNLR